MTNKEKKELHNIIFEILRLHRVSSLEDDGSMLISHYVHEMDFDAVAGDITDVWEGRFLSR